jgi:hypothetical protein
MKRMSAFVTILVLTVVASGLLLAQSNPAIGTWKLNLAKSKYNTVQPPKSTTRTVEAQGDGTKISFEGVAADESRFAYSYTTNYDGKDSQVSGSGQANGADTIAIKRVDANTATSTLKKAGKVVATTRTLVSKDGKTTTITSKGVDVNGKPRNTVSVYDKQ